MNTFPPSTCRSNSRAALAIALALGACVVWYARAQPPPTGERSVPPFLDDFNAGKPLPSFLDEFYADRETPLIAKAVDFPSAVGTVRGFWSRPVQANRLPAVLMVYDEDAWTKWMNTNVQQLASIGYEVLAINVHRRRKMAGASFTDEATLAELSGAVRWLRHRVEVLPGRLGVVGWGWSGGQALALAAALPVQACVVCDAPLPNEAGLIVGLRDTPLLAILAGADKVSENERRGFRKLLAANHVSCKLHVPVNVQTGFMGPPGAKAYAHDAAEDAWVAIYNFLEKHVEDARVPEAVARPALQSAATVADIMRAVNTPAGVRGTLSRALEQSPKTAKEWDHVRANAALIAESGAWLRARTPSKGPVTHWEEQAGAFIAAANAIVDAADRRDHAAAQQGLVKLAGQCAACHAEHR
jgi:dienelactone hydrolase